VFGHSAAGSYRTVLYGLMRCVMVQLKCWESVIKLLDGICGTAVHLSVHTVYRYGGYCCECHGENRDNFYDNPCLSCQLYRPFLLNWPIFTN
jgi:hypothetical protein